MGLSTTKFVFTKLLLVTSTLLGTWESAWSQSLGRLQGRRAIVDFPSSPEKDTEYFVVGADGVRTGLVRVTKVQGLRAVVELSKGKWATGARLEASGSRNDGSTTRKSAPLAGGGKAKQNNKAAKSFSSSSAEEYEPDASAWSAGLMLGFSNHSFSMTARGSSLSVPLSMSGSGTPILAVLEIPMMPAFSVRGKAGLDTFKVSGSVSDLQATVCNGGTSCSNSFSYLSVEAQALWKISPGSRYNPYLLGGYNFLFATSGSTTVSNFDASVKTNSAFALGGGVDIGLSGGFIPVELVYKLYQTSGDIKASSLVLSSGYLFRF